MQSRNSNILGRSLRLPVRRLAASVLFASAGCPPAFAMAQASTAKAAMELFRVPTEIHGLRILLRHEPPSARTTTRHHAPVLFVHGATFPSALAAGFRFDGLSWMDALARRGYDVWALDFIGYGGADRYPEMRESPEAHPPLGRAPEAAQEIAAAVAFIRTHTGRDRVSLIAHSWGTIPTGLYAGNHPECIARLVLFGPVAERHGAVAPAVLPAWHVVTEAEQRERFYGYVPTGESPVLDARYFAIWGPGYLASDSTSSTRTPPAVAVPYGPEADVAEAWSGHLPYDPARITAPVLIVRGEWDRVTRDDDAQWLYAALSHAPIKRDVKISRGTHVMHLEASRFQLYAEVSAFLDGDDVAGGLPGDGYTGVPDDRR